MKIFAIVLACLLLVVIGVQLYSLLGQEHDLSQTLADTETRLTKAQEDEADLSTTMQFLSNPENLTKELRAQFNYKKPGETMIVIVPETSSTVN